MLYALIQAVRVTILRIAEECRSETREGVVLAVLFTFSEAEKWVGSEALPSLFTCLGGSEGEGGRLGLAPRSALTGHMTPAGGWEGRKEDGGRRRKTEEIGEWEVQICRSGAAPALLRPTLGESPWWRPVPAHHFPFDRPIRLLELLLTRLSVAFSIWSGSALG